MRLEILSTITLTTLCVLTSGCSTTSIQIHEPSAKVPQAKEIRQLLAHELDAKMTNLAKELISIQQRAPVDYDSFDQFNESCIKMDSFTIPLDPNSTTNNITCTYRFSYTLIKRTYFDKDKFPISTIVFDANLLGEKKDAWYKLSGKTSTPAHNQSLE